MVRNLVLDNRVVYGGGAAEIASSVAVAKAADEVRRLLHKCLTAWIDLVTSDPFDRAICRPCFRLCFGFNSSFIGGKLWLVTYRRSCGSEEPTDQRRQLAIRHRLCQRRREWSVSIIDGLGVD